MPVMARGKKNANGSGTDARRRKDGRYETRATLDTPTGRRRVSFYGTTAKEANDAKFAALADQAKGVLFADPGRLKVGEYVEAWLSDTARYQVAASTYGRYRRDARNHLIPFLGRIKLRDLSPTHVRAFKARKLDDGLNPNTVGNLQSLLSGIIRQAVEDGLISSNPCSRVKKAATRGKKPQRSLTEDEANALVRTATGTRDEALIVMALRTGMRQGELAALRWEDLDLDSVRPSVTVRNSADTRTRTVITPTKTGEERVIRLGPRTVEVLKQHRARQRKERMAATSWEDPGWVFPNTKGKVRRRDSVMRSFRRMLAEAGLQKNVRFHDLRHTAGTFAVKRGRPIPAVSKMLGHSDPAMTLRIYAHVLEEMEDETGQAMDELF
jgi:integrase